MNVRHHGRGFTLTEILVVVMIIMTLVVLASPVFVHLRRLGLRTACQGNLRTIAVGLRAYLNASKDVMPVASQMPSLQLDGRPRIVDVLKPYLGAEAFRCPGDTQRQYYLSEGSSYEYQSLLGGRTIEEGFMTAKLGPALVPVMNDYEPFHGKPGKPGAMNYLFADGHVGDLR